MDRQTTETSNLNEQLFFAVRDGDTRTVADLLARGATPNLRETSSGTTPLILAVCHGDAELVKLLLAYGADTDARYHTRTAPLHIAAKLGDEAVVRELLAAGADPRSRNERGFTPLHDAACEGHAETVSSLLDSGADIDAVAGHQKETPLHMAAYHGHYEAAQILVRRGALLHPKMLDGITPLLLAAVREHLPMVRLLLDSQRSLGAPVRRVADDSVTAREICLRAAELRLQWRDESNLVKAEALFREVIREFPEHWEGHYGLGQLLHLRANKADMKSGPLIDEMIRELRRAADLAPDHLEPMLKLARVVAEFDVESAEPLYRRAMDATIPGRPTLYEASFQANDHWVIAIHAAGRSGCEGLCLEAFCRAIDFDPDYYGGVVMPASERARSIWSMALLVKPDGAPKPSERRIDPVLEEALRQARADFDEMMNSHNQSVLLGRRYRTTRSLSDLEEALELARRAVRLAPKNPKVLGNLGYLLKLLYERSGQLDDLSASISSYEAAIANSEDDAERVSNMNNLATLWQSLYGRTGKIAHLERSTEVAKEVVETTPHATPLFPMYLGNLGVKLLDRYNRTGAIEDLQAMIRMSEEALEEILSESPYRPTVLYNLALALRNRFGHSKDIRDLSRAIEAFEHACQGTPEDSMDYVIRLNGLGSGLLNRHSVTGSAEDLERAVAILEVAVERTDPSSPLFPLRLGNLAHAMLLRSEANNNGSDLQRAIFEYERLEQITPPDSPMLPTCLLQLGSALVLRWERSYSVDDWRRAIAAFQRSTQSGRDVAVHMALVAADRWLSLAVRQGEWTEAQSAYRHAWEASEKLVRIQLLRHNKESWLEPVQGLAASAAFAFAKTERCDEAAEILERGQARLLGEVLAKERTALERLASSDYADLLERYQEALGQLHHFSEQEVLSEEAHTRLSQAQAEIDQILKTVQGLEGYEGFLQPATIDEIRRAAATVPLIYIAATPVGGLALVVGGAGSGSQPSLVSPIWLPDLATDALDTTLWGKEARGEQGLLSAQRAWQQSRDLQGFESWRTAVDRSGRWLWDAVMAPILQAFPKLHTACLIPIGQLSLLPLHSAWYEDSSRPTGRTYLLDLLTVSYSPNARTWLEARRIAERVAPRRLLAIDQPSSMRVATLPSSEYEVQAVAAQFKESEIIRHQYATRDNVLRALPGHDVVHFSCHGRADLAAPLLSSLLMAGEELLTLGDILKLRLEGIRLAVLSACETGVPGTRLPEEVVSLASGLLQAGAGGVISSLAPVPDFSTMLLISTFYSLWLQGGSEPAQALRDAQIWIRDTTNSEKVQAVEDALHGRVCPGTPWWTPETAKRILAELRPRDPQARSYSHPSNWGAFHYVGA